MVTRRPVPKPTAAMREGEMQRFLWGCRPVVLAALDADELAGRYRLDLKLCECALIVVRNKRAGEAA